MRNRRKVAIIVETSGIYGRQVLQGLSRFVQTQDNWSVFLDERELLAPPPDWLTQWDGDGIICRTTTPAIASVLREQCMPVIDLNDRFGYLGLPGIASDMEAIGAMAAKHLLDRGLRNIGFAGFSDEDWSRGRYAGVEQVVANHGIVCSVFNAPLSRLDRHVWQSEREDLATWLKSLPKPVGIVASNDVRGHYVLDACRHLGLVVPDEVAVIGVDNDETFCKLCDPPLSSVMPDAERVGFESGEMLEKIMSGHAMPNVQVRIPPIGLVARESSDMVAVADPAISQALITIREHACEGLTVADLVERLGVSRSLLERGFRKHMGHSPQEEIRRVRLGRVKQLLSETGWPLERIAEKTGYQQPEYMMIQFKRAFGTTPSEWRRSQ